MGRDFAFAWRQLRTNFTFSLIVIFTLALGIGSSTAVFGLVRGVMFRALPYPAPERLVSLETLVFPAGDGANLSDAGATAGENSYPDFFDWRNESHAIQAIASYSWRRSRKFTPPGDSRPRIIQGAYVSWDFFDAIGVLPMLGRPFTRGDGEQGNRSVILGYTLWASEFGSSRNIIGEHITLSDQIFTVIGVMPAGFSFPPGDTTNFWDTLAREKYGANDLTTHREERIVNVIGRLKAGVSMAQAQAEMNTIQRRLAQQYPEDRNEYAVAVKPLLEHLTGDHRQSLYLLFAAVGAVLLIGCVNVAGLLVARGFVRRNEFAVRVALGAKPSHIVRQVLMECTALSLCAGIAGTLMAYGWLKIFLRFVPTDLPRISSVSIDGAVLAFALVTSLLTGICFGILPALGASRSDASITLWHGGRGISGSRGEHRLHGGLVIAETAISLVLLAASALLIRSFVETMRVDPGFDPHHTLTLRLGMTPIKYPRDKAPMFIRQVVERFSAIPGVESVTGSFPLPFTWDASNRFNVEGRPVDPTDPPESSRAIVEPGYFETLKIPLLRGRTFEQGDTLKAKRVTVVNEQFAREFFPGQDAVGRSIQPDLIDEIEKPQWWQIVGVVGNVRTTDLTDGPKPEFFLPYDQARDVPQGMILRVSGDPHNYVNAVRSAIESLDPETLVFEVHTLEELIANSTLYARFEAQLVSVFAVGALFLAAVGLYAALSEMVGRRTCEIGLRVALGAQRWDVFGLVVGRGLMLVSAGLGVGLSVFAIFARPLADMIYGVRLFDPFTLATAGSVLLGVSLLASLAPAWRAAQLEPTDALREQ